MFVVEVDDEESGSLFVAWRHEEGDLVVVSPTNSVRTGTVLGAANELPINNGAETKPHAVFTTRKETRRTRNDNGVMVMDVNRRNRLDMQKDLLEGTRQFKWASLKGVADTLHAIRAPPRQNCSRSSQRRDEYSVEHAKTVHLDGATSLKLNNTWYCHGDHDL